VKNPKTLLDLQKLVVDSTAVANPTTIPIQFGDCPTDSDLEPED
jgi:hypothetical protein